MAIAPTGAIYKALSFDNVSSRNYGVYITGQAVYNAPTRDVEMISIPGRNGAFALDKGRFENIEVSYPAGIFADNEANFAEAISDFRNFLCSRNGYVRLTDEYNPNEYRMAIYKSGLEVSPAQLKAGEFEIIFDCKPQRWLTSGETAVTVANNGTMTNPTLFESSPLLEVKGYGNIGFNGYELEIDNGSLGTVILANEASFAGSGTSISLAQGKLNAGDYIHLGQMSLKWAIDPNPMQGGWGYGSFSNTDSSVTDAERYGGVESITPSKTFTYGTASTYTNTKTINAYYGSTSYTATLVTTIAYDGADTITISNTVSNVPSVMEMKYAPYGHNSTVAQTTGNSSVSLLGDPTYVDCDLGECYMINNGSAVSLNQYIDLGSKLPRLAPGANTITFDNTVTRLKFVPRWWKI